MNKNRKLTLAITAMMLAILACNLPAQKPGTEAAAPTLTSQPAQASTSAPALTPTPSTPMVTVSTATNCRTGPDPSYSLVLTFQPGATAQVVGKYSASNYWIINTPTGGTCGLWGAYATVQGNTSTLAEIAPPALPPTQVVAAPPPTQVPTQPSASPTKSIVAISPIINPNIIKIIVPPSAPSKLTDTTSCQFIYFPVKVLTGRSDALAWTSVSNAASYNIYVNGKLFVQISATQYKITYLPMNPTPSGAVQFGVAATNAYGTSAITSVSSACP